ncbi:MAG TPA: TonB-dependent receptor [Bacteroidales bacterium]|nr:TonB-dependent receptor [Bacteroidales bacterium]
MKYSLFNRCLSFLMLLMLSVAVMAQNERKITGTVTDVNGDPLQGAYVVLKGTNTGVVTDAEGAFAITVENPENAVLVFSYLGFITEEFPIGTQSSIIVELDEDVTTLDELVVIGYGVVKKRDLTGSVSSIKSNEITKTASNNALQSMQGKIAGLDITKMSGESGAGINVDLRGVRSVWASNEPLFLVDGIEYGSTLDINASDIESIEVLKDASSTAIYGTRGANGVVIITTKKGALAAEKMKVSFNSYLSFNSPTNLPKLMSVEQDYRLLAERQRFAAEDTDDSWGSTSLSEYPASTVLSNTIDAPWEKSVYELYQEGGVDWFDMMLHNSTTQNYEISLSGGSEKTSFMFSLGYMDEEGLLKNDELNRYNGRLSIDHKLKDNLKVGAGFLYTYRDWDRREDDVFGQLIKMHSIAEPYQSDGTILDRPSQLAVSHTNPLLNEVEGYYDNNTISNRLFGNVYLDWELLKGVKFKSVFGLDQYSRRAGEYEDYMCTGNYQTGRSSYFEAENELQMNYSWENTLNYGLTIDSHEIQLLAGQSAYQDKSEVHNTFGFGLQDHYGRNSFYDLSNIVTKQIADNYVQSNMLSWFGRLNYKFRGKYLFTASFRADGSSVLAPGNKWGYFPSVAAAWVISEENFMKSMPVVNNLKLRASWGKAGNSAVDPYQTMTTLGIEKVYYTFGPIGNQVVYTGQMPANLGNPDVTWETTTTYDIGLDISLLRSRVSSTFDLYYSNTTDLLLFKGLPATSVYPQVLANVGETENTGFEVSLNIRAIEQADFRWQTDLAFSTNRDRIVALSSGEVRDVSRPETALVVGEPVRAFYDYEADGCWSIAEAETAAAYTRVPGAIKLVDVNMDTVLNDADKRLYNKSPKFIFSMNNTVSYKNLSLSALVYARAGQWIRYDYNTAYKPTEQDGSPAVDFWTPENQDAKFPRPGIVSQNDMPALAYENASFLKIKEITLSYNIPQPWINKIGITNLRVYTSMQNYLTFSNLDNYDPERGGEISNPLAKQFIFGLNVDF